MTDSELMVIAGASGVVGRYIIDEALERGFRIRVLTRNESSVAGRDSRVEARVWNPRGITAGDPAALEQTAAALEGASFLVNLAGAPISAGRFTKKQMALVMNSRLETTGALGRAWLAAEKPPLVWWQSSATGYYGDTGEAEVDEETTPGDLFLSEVCRSWEERAHECLDQTDHKLRMIIGRIGIVLAPDAKAWKIMLLPIRLFAGGPLGNGRQYYPWIEAGDLARAVFHLYESKDASGPYNFTAPEPVRQGELVRRSAAILRRPGFWPTPAFLLRLILGQAADEMVLASCQAKPRRLLESGFKFERAGIEAGLEYLLKGDR